ncbi:unnamed protein product, partial [Mesorhabditis spiculigera]
MKGWLDYQNDLCPTIDRVVPSQIQVTTSDYVNVTIQNVGEAKGKLRCQFRFTSPYDQVVDVEPPKHHGGSDGTIRCATPSLSRIPPIPANQSYLVAALAITPEGRTAPIATTNFTFYDCGKYKSCSECTRSQFPCDWCLESNECVDGKLTEDRCRQQNFINGIARKGQSSRQGPNHCPYIKAPHGKMFVGVGEKRNVSVKVANLDPSVMHKFRCSFRIGQQLHEKQAALVDDDTIVCDEMRFNQPELKMISGTAPVDFQVNWSSPTSDVTHAFDNVNGTAVEVYRCEELASNCGLCLSLDPTKFDCGWCEKDAKCVRPRACRWRSPSDWLNSTQLCPHPVIISFDPKKGPAHGNTKIRVTGVNLGRSAADLRGAVLVANVPCTVQTADFISPSEFYCTTKNAPGVGYKGPMILKLQDSPIYSVVTTEQFSYVEPKILGVDPVEGPTSGGTDLVLNGENLDLWLRDEDQNRRVRV